MNLNGNTILITGGTSGIGLELARQLLEKGNTVIVTGRDPKKIARAKELLPAIHTVVSDVAQSSEIEALAERVTREFPKLNFLINNAGIMRTINLHAATELGSLTQEIETNMMGPVRMVQAFLPHLKKQSAAAIVNVTSGLAFAPLPTSPVYCATKAGLHSYTLSLRVQLKKSHVKVFELAPPATATPLLDGHSAEDMKGITIMPCEEMVREALRGFESDRFEICPGQSKQLRMMSRVAPAFILTQMSRPVERLLRS